MKTGVVIVLEDEEFSMSVFCRTLELGGYECVEARNESDAIKPCRNHPGTVIALIADLVLPTCRGTDVALAALRIRPDLRVLFASGTPVDGWPEADVRKMAELPPASFAFIMKPFRPNALLDKLKRLLGAQAVLQTAS